MTEFFYKVLFRGLLACAALVGLIISLVVYRKMWLGGNSLADLGTEGNILIFMGVLVAICLFMSWRIKKAMNQLDT